MNEKGTHRVPARDYFSDSSLVRFWQFLAYFSNKDYGNHKTVLSEITRTKLGTSRLWIIFLFLLGKLLNVDVSFVNQKDQEGSRKCSPQVHLFQSYARSKSSHKIACDFLKFSEASEQQRIKHSQRSKLFITLNRLRCVPSKTPEFCDPPSHS